MRRKAWRPCAPILLAALLAIATLAACGASETVQGGARENGAHARVKIGVPF
jgi:hypothetical protein